MEQSLFQHLPKLVRAKTQDSIELILRSLWRTRKSGLDAAEKAHLQDLLQLPSHEELDPIVACLRMLIRKCIHENLGEEELQKLFPPEFPLDLQSLLVLLLKKLQIEWGEDMAKDQLEWPRTRVVYQVKVGPTVPQTSPANMVPPVWPRLEDNRRPFNRCELGVPLGMPSGNLNSSRLVPQQPPQDDINGDSSLVSLPRLKAMTWSMENQNSTPANRVAVINLKRKNCAGWIDDFRYEEKQEPSRLYKAFIRRNRDQVPVIKRYIGGNVEIYVLYKRSVVKC
ncbi:hypothetical protein SUGI_0702280, partial [Cryptomeria japonica]